MLWSLEFGSVWQFNTLMWYTVEAGCWVIEIKGDSYWQHKRGRNNVSKSLVYLWPVCIVKKPEMTKTSSILAGKIALNDRCGRFQGPGVFWENACFPSYPESDQSVSSLCIQDKDCSAKCLAELSTKTESRGHMFFSLKGWNQPSNNCRSVLLAWFMLCFLPIQSHNVMRSLIVITNSM